MQDKEPSQESTKTSSFAEVVYSFLPPTTSIPKYLTDKEFGERYTDSQGVSYMLRPQARGRTLVRVSPRLVDLKRQQRRAKKQRREATMR